MLEVKETLKVIDNYKSNMLKKKDPLTLREELKMK